MVIILFYSILTSVSNSHFQQKCQRWRNDNISFDYKLILDKILLRKTSPPSFSMLHVCVNNLGVNQSCEFSFLWVTLNWGKGMEFENVFFSNILSTIVWKFFKFLRLWLMTNFFGKNIYKSRTNEETNSISNILSKYWFLKIFKFLKLVFHSE